MGLFQRQPITETSTYYRIGNEQTKLVVGLGNIGKDYDRTRHNVGFASIDHFAEKQGAAYTEKKSQKCQVASVQLGDKRLIVIKPTTFMNLSGEAVRAVQQFYKITNDETLVVHDELDIPFGQIKIRAGGGSAGNNGIKSLIEHIGDDFMRIRIGIANEFSAKADASDFVLGKFTSEEQQHFSELFSEVSALITEFAYGNLNAETRKFL